MKSDKRCASLSTYALVKILNATQKSSANTMTRTILTMSWLGSTNITAVDNIIKPTIKVVRISRTMSSTRSFCTIGKPRIELGLRGCIRGRLQLC